MYDEKKTEVTVHRLSNLKTFVRLVTIFGSIVIFGSLFFIVGKMDSPGTAQIMGIAGLVIGFFVGKFVADLSTVILDWHAQVLIALENALQQFKSKG